MNTPFLSETEIQELSKEIDHQLREVAAVPISGKALIRGEATAPLPEAFRKQFETVATATKSPARSFLSRFLRAARNDLCNPGGSIYTQWKKWGDIENPEVIRSIAGVLAGMGITGHLIPTLVVPLAVIVLHVGIKAICEETERESG